MTDFISIYGQVQDNDFNPIPNIKVSVFDKHLYYIDHKHTDIDGTYHLSIPSGRPITMYFDTDSSLKNAREWHPSVVANIDTKQDIVLNRFLMQINDSTGAAADIDALTAYQFIVRRTHLFELDKTYAENAAYRVSTLMIIQIPELYEFQKNLEDFFLKKSKTL